MYSTTISTEKEKEHLSNFRMILYGVVLVIPTFLSGFNLSYPAVALPQMNLDIDDASWFASVALFASPISVVIIGFIIDRYGRKPALLYTIVPSIAGWSLLHWNQSVVTTLLGQTLNGLTINAGFYPVQVYAGECVMADNVRMRNIFLTWIGLSTSFGTTSMLILGNFFVYRQICLISAVLSAITLAIFYVVIPESPAWLHSKGRIGDAEWSQKKLGIARPILKGSVEGGGNPVPSTSEEPVIREVREKGIRRKLVLLTRPDVYKPVVILSVGTILGSLCGIPTVITYLINIINNTIPGVDTTDSQQIASNLSGAEASSTPVENEYLVESYELSLYSAALMCAGSLVSVYALPWLGLKRMLIQSKLIIILAMLIVCFGSEYMPESNMLTRAGGVAIITFLAGSELGPRMSFPGDVFPVDAKGFASVPAVAGSITVAVANKIFPYLRMTFGGYAYCFFSVMCLPVALFVHFFIPEVVGRTLEEINNDYAKSDD